jgi:hypothetical protein
VAVNEGADRTPTGRYRRAIRGRFDAAGSIAGHATPSPPSSFDSALNFLMIALLYFTVSTRLTNGRTPGKWLLRIRARRLDGAPFDWGSAFGRAGGPGAPPAGAAMTLAG